MITTNQSIGGKSVFSPTAAYVIYEAEEQKFFPSGTKAIAVKHSIVGVTPEQKPIFGSGKIVTASLLETLMHALGQKATLFYLQESILAASHHAVCWFTPPAVRTIWIHLDRESLQKNKSPVKITSMHPGLVFLVVGKHFSLHAVRGDQRPSPVTPLYLPPYFNMYTSGGLCIGNTPFPEYPSPENYRKYEEAFFASVFTHPNNRMTLHPQGDYAFWRAIHDNPSQEFPYDLLVPAEKTLGQLLSGG